MRYRPDKIEKKWQDIWYGSDIFHAKDNDEKPKYYALVEFPYPSGAGMHVGHIRAYTGLEVVARKRRMDGYNVLFPIGFDAFGLPTENYAIQQKIHPRTVTDENIKIFTKQLKAIGYSFDFNRVVDTTDPDYYRWTQWIFLKLYKHELAYRDKTHVNFCPSCKVVLSNEESQGGRCDRCDASVEQKEKDVWFLKITEYAEKLLEGLGDLEASPRILTEQENWIGKSAGIDIDFDVPAANMTLNVFTTRPDTLYGATFMVIAPEHPLLENARPAVRNIDEVERYREKTRKKSEFERTQLSRDKDGVVLEGLYARNPATGNDIPVYIADYVMMGYGTGAIMGVPGHDQRDYEFARRHGLDIVEVIRGGDISQEAFTDTENGVLINSDLINGLPIIEAIKRMEEHLIESGRGRRSVHYKMKDWAFNRQRYWGEPIPIVHCGICGMVPVPESELPVRLPDVEHFEPNESGESPLANIDAFVNTTCPNCGGPAKRETDTMPQWAGSSWYFLRYADPKNNERFADMKKLEYWLPVDWYNGGMEHVTRHVIYSRFWHRFLHDIGEAPMKEPYRRRTNQGLILGADGDKMSKSKGNVVNPMDMIEEYGADTLRLYILFIGDYEQSTPWSDSGVKGARRFLEKMWRMLDNVTDAATDTAPLESTLHKTIAGVSEDIEQCKFNTAVAKLMALSNAMQKEARVHKTTFITALKLLYPFAPHIAEELNERLGETTPLAHQAFPVADPAKMVERTGTVVISINGKVRDKMTCEPGLSDDTLVQKALAQEKIRTLLEGKAIKKTIVVPNKLVNIVV